MAVKLDTMHLNNMPTDKYREYKIRILERDFKIKLSPAELKHFELLTTDNDIERYFNSILNENWV